MTSHPPASTGPSSTELSPVEPSADPSSSAGSPGLAARTWARLSSWSRGYPHRLDTIGLLVAILSAWASLTPSLIPRTWAVQGIVTGLSVISGYAIGTFVSWVLGAFDVRLRPGARGTALTRRLTAIVGAAGLVVMLVLGSGWQDDVREALRMPTTGADWGFVLVPVLAVVIAVPILALFRWLRRRVQQLARFIGRRVPRAIAQVTATIIVVVLSWSIFSGVLWNGIIDGLEASFAAATSSFDPDLDPPTLAERSGSPEATTPWDSLGREGRRFVTGGATVAQIAAFQSALPSGGGRPASEVDEPIRVYSGLDDDLERTAANVVAELDRTGAWDREDLLVVTTTGTGWVDPSMADAFELLHGGDTAIAAMQYSNLPSWLSFVGDREQPPIAGKALFEAVYHRWSELPESSRPHLYVAGISLGSFGMQSAFSGVQDIAQRTDGALFVGTPNFTELWSELTESRDAGSGEVSPVIDDGATVRFLTGAPGTPGDPLSLDQPWDGTRILYAQHGSDGVTWWGPSLIWAQPDWLREPRAADVSDDTLWFPAVSFWQVTFDMFMAAGEDIPMGSGHQYELEYADGFAAISAPAGWTVEDTLALRQALLLRQSS